jgi:hypothetical protein
MDKTHIFFVSCILALIQISCSENANKTHKVADEVILNLEKFKTTYGEYPDSLSLLVPNYFQELPRTFHNVKRNGFYYAKHIIVTDSTKLEFFELWYNAPLGVEAKYNSYKKKWEYDD